MKFTEFHDPDISLPVVCRRASEEFLVLLMHFGEVVTTHGRSLTWSRNFPSDAAYWSSINRLRRSGLIVTRSEDGAPCLELSEEGNDRMPLSLRPHKLWKRRWKGFWYILAYDVPESRKSYREGLRRFLHRKRMGCLQRSVWITPDDVRPEYDDLVHGAGVSDVSFLFESRSVLGRSHEDIVRTAWQLDSLQDAQESYCARCRENTRTLGQYTPPRDDLLDLARRELHAYLGVMASDPFLPRVLWPSGYMGEQAHETHKAFTKKVAALL